MILSRSFINKWLLITLFLFGLGKGLAIAQNLSPQARISLITCSPGDELYSMYGHSAIRVADPTYGIDYVFNYGTFDFSTPNFYPKFVMGKLKYKLAVSNLSDFLAAYQYYNRSVYEQVLNLTLPQKNNVFRFLQTNYLPENREYYYDFFFDNCATRIRDVFQNTLGDSLRFNPALNHKKLSFRQIVGIYQNPFPWADFGVDLAMGATSDRQATASEYMFIPDYLQEGFSTATLQNRNGKAPFAQPVATLFKADSPVLVLVPLRPGIICWALFILGVVLTWWQWRQKRPDYSFDVVLFSVVGLLGFVLLFLTTSSDYKAFGRNLNLLWAIPLHLPVGLLLLRKKTLPFVKTYFLITAIVTGLLLILWQWIPQEYHPAFFPVLLLLGLRAGYIYFTQKHFIQKRTQQRVSY
ncbi:Lnb N-terminal periplasmic domain-containing protein [Adhaeribacter radiodurans]|uniref:DUF4105 domain-containing protein n=1 Tax=Adhaeribacter radiodurans TaxID=2745197 RepID=A0A7L7LDM6_9BACT|nr:DUF4105 domain-containing protein [Adhaeribacter radiodurans]QMU30938.1 DUF4105 domain-containing protein [Adhaeribacter radiodurans]